MEGVFFALLGIVWVVVASVELAVYGPSMDVALAYSVGWLAIKAAFK